MAEKYWRGLKRIGIILKDAPYQGYSTVNFCPSCMKVLLTEDETEELFDFFFSNNFEGFQMIIEGKDVAGFGVFFPTNKELLQLLNYRCIVYPFCHTCSVNMGTVSGESEAQIERNLVVSRRTAKVRKSQS